MNAPEAKLEDHPPAVGFPAPAPSSPSLLAIPNAVASQSMAFNAAHSASASASNPYANAGTQVKPELSLDRLSLAQWSRRLGQAFLVSGNTREARAHLDAALKFVDAPLVMSHPPIEKVMALLPCGPCSLCYGCSYHCLYGYIGMGRRSRCIVERPLPSVICTSLSLRSCASKQA